MKKKLKTLSVSVSAAIIVAAWSAPASATSWMTDFYTTAGGSMNVTPGAVYQTQTTNVISGGGFAMRAPRKNVQFLTVTPPGYKAGCGGIDFWAGSFGFINKEQLVQFLRNVGQNALGLFFQLALKSMAPEVAATIEVMQDWAQRINQFNMNSCETAQQFINEDNFSFAIREEGKERAAAIKDWGGEVADRFLGKLSTRDSAANTRATNEAAKTANPDEWKLDYAYNTNITWKLLSRISGMSDQEKELIMSLVGTTITSKANDSKGAESPITKGFADQISINELIGNRAGDTSARIYSCDGDSDCLSLPELPDLVSYTSFARIAFNKMKAIKAAIVTRSAQDPANLALVDMTSVPIYRLIAVTTLSKYPALSDTIIEKYADVVGLDLAMVYLEYLSEEVRRQIKVEVPHQPKVILTFFENLEKTIDKKLEAGRAKRLELISQRSALMANIAEIEHIERTLFSNLSASMAANLRFGQKM